MPYDHPGHPTGIQNSVGLAEESVFSKWFGRRADPVTREVNVLCKFWYEDGVWNGSAQDLPVAVYGHTIEDAKKHLCEAVICHLEALEKIGRIEPELDRLDRLAHECRLAISQIAAGELFSKTTAMVSDHKVTHALCD